MRGTPKERRGNSWGHAVRLDDQTYQLLLRMAEQSDRTLVSVLRAAVRQLATIQRADEASA
jgi:predicted transcriptional regulator